ncbi:hypothetical protein LCGC14_2998390 [marine sediment metagenome]|uniref:VRR-NUC domain-containing protein n=1 Tax=marine sediment metagenome TaxID=412755 RepID=A0A0F8X1S1_9ZZZZ
MDDNLDKLKGFLARNPNTRWSKNNPKLKVPAKKSASRKRVTPKRDLEAAVQKEGLAILAKHGIYAWRQNAGKVRVGEYWMQLAPPGAADVTGILSDGKRLEAEAKRRYGGVQSRDQKRFQTMIEARNGVYVLFHSAKELIEKLQKYGYCK